MHLFPTGLESSLFPAIFVGVIVTFAATETLGWTFTGLVVPGYLGAVALVAPAAAGLMFIEALVALAAVRLLSDAAAWSRIGSRFFGRERFFLVLVVATAVRLVLDRTAGALLHGGGDDTAHSIGLVLVPLIAHSLDKNGPVRGALQLAALTAITGGIVALLAAATNFSLADLSLTFDDVAYAIDQHPKAYLVMLCAAFLAARANVAFGWDFHGIIVPGLLAVAWFQPSSVLATIVEAIAALIVARGLALLPGLRGRHLDGPRRLVVVFCADALLKVTILSAHAPAELFGFGYLLPALLADKMWQRASLARVLLPATQVSLGGFLVGNFIIWVLARGLGWMAPAVAAPVAVEPVPAERALAVSRALVARDGGRTRLSSRELALWKDAWARYGAGTAPLAAFARLAAPGVEVAPVAGEGAQVVVREHVAQLAELRGLGTVLARVAGRRVILGVPRPLDGDLTLVTGDVAAALDARVVIVGGRPGEPRMMGALPTSKTPYRLAVDELVDHLLVELTVDEAAPAGGRVDVGPAVWPEALDLPSLRGLLPEARVRWIGSGGPVVIAAPAATWRALAARPCAAAAATARPFAALVKPTGDELDVAERLLYAESIVRPLATGEPGAACRAARALGLEVATLEDAGGDRHLAVLSGARQAAVVALRTGVDSRHVIGAPIAGEPFTDRAAAALAQRLRARAVVLGGPATTPATSSYDAAIEALAGEVDVLEVRGGSFAHGAVLSSGGLGGDAEWITPFERALASLGIPAERYDGRPEHACCGDLGSARRARLAQSGRAHLAAVYLSMAARERRFLDGGAQGDRELAGELGLAEVAAPLPQAVARALEGAPCAALEPALAAARRWAELRHIADLKVLAGRRGVSLAHDPLTDLSFVLVASRCGARTAYGVVALRDAPPGVALVDDVRWGAAAEGVAP